MPKFLVAVVLINQCYVVQCLFFIVCEWIVRFLCVCVSLCGVFLLVCLKFLGVVVFMLGFLHFLVA